MQHQEFEAPLALRDSIKCFWYTRMDFAELESQFEVQPDGYAEIIFYFGSACSIVLNGALQSLPSPFMMGLLNKPVLFHATNPLEIIGIRCFPWTVFELLSLEPGKEGVRTFEHPIARLQTPLNACMQAGKISEAVAVVTQYFLEENSPVMPVKTQVDNTLSRAGAAMQDAKGTMPVSQVAAAAHATVRTLQRKFLQSSGHTVKDVSGLMRFEQLRNHLWLYPDCNLAGLALELGYADQAHLGREFKRYSGSTPAAFARKAKHRKQLVTNDFVAFIQA